MSSDQLLVVGGALLWVVAGLWLLHLALPLIKQAVLIDVDRSKPYRLHGTQIRPRNGLLLVTKSVTEQQQLTPWCDSC